MVLDTDSQAVSAGLLLAGGEDAKVIRIKDTLNLQYVMVSANMLDEVKESPDLELINRKVSLLSKNTGLLAPFPDF
jgi:hypothetical protein